MNSTKEEIQLNAPLAVVAIHMHAMFFPQRYLNLLRKLRI